MARREARLQQKGDDQNHFRQADGAVHTSSIYAAPNGLELTGDGGAAAGVRCSDLLGHHVEMPLRL